ncbi:LOB domain-containing protein 39-like [Phalaenopsis equestris]|uniref:LOB domain-containing protein 39-like n=1 Tax=Phalaenopsis equestris TaxID=78828 RepID=UPI0009E30705|nr:LOB domain-containing protein 39-like [Phalaenopsis equestris]
MSCNGCRVLRKGCSESCILRSCLQWIESPEAQGHATVFVAKFFGRAGLMAFLSSVPEENRPALFQSLLFESCGRSINPVSGAVGLIWTRKWNLCLEAVETVLRGGTIRPISELPEVRAADDEEVYGMWPKSPLIGNLLSHVKCDLELYLRLPVTEEKEMPGTPSMNSSTTGDEDNCIDREQRVLNLFV